MALAEKKCTACSGAVAALKGAALCQLQDELKGWRVVNQHHLEREFKFPDFASALAFVNEIGRIADSEGHHPDIALSWGRVGVTIWTHKVDGLTESDFILAAKIDRAMQG